MARAKLEYDDSGTTFYYFLLSFYALILIPATYFIFPRKKKGEVTKAVVCQCEPCLAKKIRLEQEKPKQWMAVTLRYAVLAVLWGILIYMVYKVLSADKDYIEYDPFEILQLDPGVSMSEIKKQYRKLSKVFHPDKQGGDQDMFMKIAKAYEALTDEVSRENWEKWGNPDGPQAASFGIALPSWIVEKQNSLWVLVAYMSVFMIALPLIVGVWWYRSIKYGSSNVLIQTTQLFAYFLNNTKAMPVKRVLMVLTAAMEFNHELSPLVPTRPSDDMELNQVISSRTLPHARVKTKERFLCLAYAIKARVLLHSHLERVPLHSSFLESDQQIVLKKCPQLIQEMISVLCQLWAYRMRQPQGHGRAPSLDLFEEVMKSSGVIVQAMWLLGNSPLLQLPHLSPPLLRHFRTKKRCIASIEQFASLSDTDRRSLVRTLSDDEYCDLIAVCATFPKVTIEAKTQVVDDDDSDVITASSVVTLSVSLSRQSLQEAYNLGTTVQTITPEKGQEVEPHTVPMCVALGMLSPPQDGADGADLEEREEEKEQTHNGLPPNNVAKKPKKPVVSAKKKQSKVRRRTLNPKKVKKSDRTMAARLEECSDEGEGEVEGRGRKGDVKGKVVSGGREDSASGSSEGEGEGEGQHKDEEEEWNRLQKSLQKHSKKKFEPKATDSHPVHAPYFPEEKLELWWLYVTDKKKRQLICLPTKITGLMKNHMTELHFAAPDKPGQYRYTVVLRSDSYLDLFFSQDIRLNVGAQQEVRGRDQWAELEKEEEEEEMIEESESELEESSQMSDSD